MKLNAILQLKVNKKGKQEFMKQNVPCRVHTPTFLPVPPDEMNGTRRKNANPTYGYGRTNELVGNGWLLAKEDERKWGGGGGGGAANRGSAKDKGRKRNDGEK